MTFGSCCRAERRAAALALLVVLLAACSGRGTKSTELVVENAWARPTSGEVGAVYLSVVNHSSGAVHLRAAGSDVAETVELHRTRIKDDRMRMEPLPEGVAIDAGATLAFEPGGYHVMLIGLRRPLLVGETFELNLEFDSAGSRSVSVVVAER